MDARELADIKRRAGISEGRHLRAESEFVYDIMMLVNSAKDECQRNPDEMYSKLSQAASMLNELLHGRGRR